ncbi:hypothetical protein HDK77DRAFT_72588 [Phyllosticta capitalensis]|uniref:Myb-like domain-containing protein n=1 Tax=Phyllosticta capitalensis TaxID=121624 RepID=A0ABR1YQ27_9PEZI
MADKGARNPDVSNLFRDSLLYWVAGGSVYDRRQRKYTTRPPPKRVTDTQHHTATTEPAEVEVKMAKPEESKQASDGKSGQNGQGGDKKQGKVDLTFTAEEDATLLEMKHKGDSWKMIAQALKKPQGAIKNRFKEIAPDDLKATVGGKGNADEKRDAPAKKENAQQKSKNNSEKKQTNNKSSSAKNNDSSKDKKDDQSVRSGSSASRIMIPQYINGLETITLRPDETFTANDLVWLCDAFMRDNDERFIRLSSRYYDMTGRRIHPATIRDKLMRSGFAV